MAAVYVIRHRASAKCYVGKAQDPEQRWRQHRVDAKCGRESALCRALRKYGPDAFVWRVLEQCESDAAAYAAEVRWIRMLDCTTEGHGYNLTGGGEGLSNATPATRAAMSRAKLGRAQDPELVAKRRVSLSTNGKRAATEAAIRECLAEDPNMTHRDIGHRIGRTGPRVGQILKAMGIVRGRGKNSSPEAAARGAAKRSGRAHWRARRRPAQ